ncbi:MAG TPA: hypothetical protein VHH36_03810 [Candidatus Thermoplasmatota archaeon]|nr:hypothetical protein [Candidatus Thermoplasmatota archaeon]
MPSPRAAPVAALLALLVALPTTLASWKGPGTVEPDTDDDLAHGSMFPEPDWSPNAAVRKVYFNAFQALPGTSANPNAAALGTRIQPAPAAHHRAILGVWKDCNKDGYIGHAESAVQDYRVELLNVSGVCQPQAYAGFPVHNDGAWVSELLAIGMVDPCEFQDEPTRRARCGNMPAFAKNERVHYSNDTYVWGDAGTPGAAPVTACSVLPMPRGAADGTGALVGYADCYGERNLADTINFLDRQAGIGLGFEDPARPEESASPLNQPLPVTLFGRPGQAGLLEADAQERSVTLWDCSQPKGGADARDPQGPRDVAVADPSGGKLGADAFPWVIVYAMTGVGFRDEDRDPATPGVLRAPLTDEEGSYAWAPAPAPGLDDPAASWWAGLDHAADGPNGDCDPGTPGSIAPFHPGDEIESGQGPVRETVKDRPSYTFAFYDGHRGVNPNIDHLLGPTAPSDGGLFYTDHDRSGDGPLWSALAEAPQDPQLVNRNDLGPTPARHFTYYAHVGSDLRASVTLPLSTHSIYGVEACGAGTAPRGGWICDPEAWWKGRFGEDERPRYAQGGTLGRAVGDFYHMRDVDCYDGRVAAGVHASLAQASGEPTCA